MPTDFGAVTALTAEDVWIVGNDGPATAASHWNGKKWHREQTPSPGHKYNVLNAVDASVTDDVWAVGHSSDAELHGDALIEHWDGTAWQVVPSPRTDRDATFLKAVSVGSPHDAWAVGFASDGGRYPDAVAEHWNGSEWQLVSAGAHMRHLWDVDAVSPSDAWAVGDFHQKGGPHAAVVVHWDGESWKVVERLDNADRKHVYELSGVVAADPDDVWAVGEMSIGYRRRALVMHWNGSEWAEVSVGVRQNAGLVDVSVDGAGGLFIVGHAADRTSGPLKPMVLRWDGSTWMRDEMPELPGGAYLWSVTSLSPDRAWAVGRRFPGGLLLTWDGAAWQE